MSAKTVLTPPCILSFADLGPEPKKDMNGTLGFRAELLFPKRPGILATLHDMKLLHDATIPKAWFVDGGVPHRKFEACFINGDTKKQDGRKGKWIMRAKSGVDHPPKLKRWDNASMTPGQMYPGANVRALLSTFFWTAANKETGAITSRGVSFNLCVVQMLNADGVPFGNFVSDEEIEAALAAAPLEYENGLTGEDLLG